MNLVVVGSVGLDDVETPFGRVERALGGSAIYFALAASFFEKPGFVGVVGTDFPQAGLDLLESKGVDLRGLERVEGKTFRWAGRYGYDLNQRDTLLTELNVFADFRPQLPADYRDVRFLFLGNIHPSLQMQVLDQARSPSFVALDTMNYWIEGANDDLRRVLARVNAVLINDSEARELSGESNIVRACSAIAKMGPKLVVIKRGEYGALICNDGEFFYVPAYPLSDVVDPTGAGDCFAGGFMGWIARQGETSWRTLCQAAVAGSTLAAFSVEKFSVDRFATLGAGEIAARYQRFRDLTDFTPLEQL
jgi:sugar/nucleoside kinase (ribokinase family)